MPQQCIEPSLIVPIEELLEKARSKNKAINAFIIHVFTLYRCVWQSDPVISRQQRFSLPL